MSAVLVALSAVGGFAFAASALPVGLAAIRGVAGGVPRTTAWLIIIGSGSLLAHSLLIWPINASLVASYWITLLCWSAALTSYGQRHGTREWVLRPFDSRILRYCPRATPRPGRAIPTCSHAAPDADSSSIA
jgi:hypothetical protein